jgi:hypothetical protein
MRTGFGAKAPQPIQKILSSGKVSASSRPFHCGKTVSDRFGSACARPPKREFLHRCKFLIMQITAVNSGDMRYEEIVVFFLAQPDDVPQPGAR